MSKDKAIDSYMDNLADAGLTPEQLELARNLMLEYALCAMMDSSIREEIESEIGCDREMV